MKAVISFILCVWLLAEFIPQTQSFCCLGGGSSCEGNYCKDCTRKRLSNCCSTGSCNVFCCNCNKECRKPPAGKINYCISRWVIPLVWKKISCQFKNKRQGRDIAPERMSASLAIDKFNQVDFDNDLKISQQEMKAHLGNNFQDQHIAKEFSKMDENQNGFIEAREFDQDISEDML